MGRKKLIKWKTKLYAMSEEFADGDEVTVGVNLVNMNNGAYEEGSISPAQWTYNWATE